MFDFLISAVSELPKTDRIALRLESELREKIDKLVKTGKFKNLSEVIRKALRQFLSKELNEL